MTRYLIETRDHFVREYELVKEYECLYFTKNISKHIGKSGRKILSGKNFLIGLKNLLYMHFKQLQKK